MLKNDFFTSWEELETNIPPLATKPHCVSSGFFVLECVILPPDCE